MVVVFRNFILPVLFSVSVTQFLRVLGRPQDLVSQTVAVEESRAISDTFSDLNSPVIESTGNRTIGTDWDGPIRKCPRGDSAALNECLRQILSDLKPRLPQGIPELNLPSMDPLRLKTVRFRHGNGPIKLLATFTNVEATGLSQYQKSDFAVDMGRKSLTFDMGIPQMQMIGNYDLTGNLFVFPIGGTGNFWLHLVDIRPKGQGSLEIVQTPEGKKSLQLKSIDLDLGIGGMKAHLTNLFNGDKFLGNVMNNFINEHGMEIFAELRPQIAKRVGEMVKVLSNKALGALSSEYFEDLNPTIS